MRTLLLALLLVGCAPAPKGDVSIAPEQAEVWADDVELHGAAPAPLASCRVLVEGRAFDARVDGQAWSARVPVAPGPSRARAECADASGAIHTSPLATLLTRAEERRAARPGPSARPEDDVLYGVVPPLYGAPPLRAVTGKIADLADLGVTALWLAPIFETTPGDYGYAVTDYFRLRRDYGSEDDLRALVGEAHAHGLKVLVDLVPNHTSIAHPYFAEAERLGRASHYLDFYERDASGAPSHYFDWSHLPNLAYGNREVRRWMLAVSEHWLRAFGLDGFRVDAAWAIRERAPDFWDAWTARVREAAPGALLVAEGSARDSFWAAHGFDAAYDWTGEIGHGAWEHAFDDLDLTADLLDAAIAASRTRPLRFLENNDTGPRFVTAHGPELTRVAAAALLTSPGVPCLFTGEERGAEYEPYARRAPLDDADPHALRDWHKRLLALRRTTPALRGDGYARVPLPNPRVLAYMRTSGDDEALVLLHFGDRPTRLHLPAKTKGWRDRLSGRRAEGTIELEGWGVRVLTPA